MLNNLFNSLFEAQIVNPIWLKIIRGCNLVVWIYAARGVLCFVFQVLDRYRAKMEEIEAEKNRRPIGFR